MNILDKIVAEKKNEVARTKVHADLNGYHSLSADFDRKCISLKENLCATGGTGIIAEFKRKSPSKGWFKTKDYPTLPILGAYEKFGAAGASVLTDSTFFGGDISDIAGCRKVSNLPILRKDFIIDEIQIREAKACGADVILLIAAILAPKRVEELANEAKKYGLEVLLELHEENEYAHICDAIDLIGINNRNLKTFEVDINHSIKLSKRLPDNKIKIAESGIDNMETMKIFKDAGFQGFLIGEKFMREADPGKAFEKFVQQLKQG